MLQNCKKNLKKKNKMPIMSFPKKKKSTIKNSKILLFTIKTKNCIVKIIKNIWRLAI